MEAQSRDESTIIKTSWRDTEVVNERGQQTLCRSEWTRPRTDQESQRVF